MIPKVSKIIPWIKDNKKFLKKTYKGIERESLRIDIDGNISKKPHPIIFGSPLTHNWITTDFSESLLELITPVSNSKKYTINFLNDLHIFIIKNLINENLWPMSMPCKINNDSSIIIAQYGNSKLGRTKTIYRNGLKNRYGAKMQIISGVHYNFSFHKDFWKKYNNFYKIQDKFSSIGYFNLIRNYYRFGWIIPYFFGASPIAHSSFFKGLNTDLIFKKNKFGDIYLPFSTSLRLSEIGYINKVQKKIKLKFNNIEEYVDIVKKAMKTPYLNYKKIELKNNEKNLQINVNLLQKENELYSHVRPKRSLNKNKYKLEDLIYKGIEYIEIRSLDVNPFSPIGIKINQIYFLDIFLIWCILIESPKINDEELRSINENWNRVILYGRNPKIKLINFFKKKEKKLSEILKFILNDLQILVESLAFKKNNKIYQKIFFDLHKMTDNPNKTLSGKLLEESIEYGVERLGLDMSKSHKINIENKKLKVINYQSLIKEAEKSIKEQIVLEKNET
ncbi:gshA [Wigglesworthia glossinidia endosymbiont of Glossina brevipalpis]|uniref:Glutamate--cysteine ligase n=1 Tax=Wigglesworthia glossinidia brevipalpis TaxID=36870 RepID=GSH1_WIGBR|nr:RecName: Full=Glutamate--cysteine ligase; AltName: Full=Gamma-ECS; Short=GCS; AltName: Full=Gamma-glutamylcysteine synthetase [Wigglesworthia glossinidia endosymbiont of Glossina brevipalpis]BAC24393.1 gshA [Wigglesworthia glossinidia endosymbiont of Glossina brevipalpis]